MIFLQYCGKVTNKFKCLLKKLGVPIKVILTLRKLRTVLSSLKPFIEKSFKRGIQLHVRDVIRAMLDNQFDIYLPANKHSRINSRGITFSFVYNITFPLTMKLNSDHVKFLEVITYQRSVILLMALSLVLIQKTNIEAILWSLSFKIRRTYISSRFIINFLFFVSLVLDGCV